MKHVYFLALGSFLFLMGACQQQSPPAPNPNPQTVDVTPPVITISGGNSQTQMAPQVPGNGVWVNPSATALDNVDGNISANITITGTVDPNTVGSDTLYYSVSDAAGNQDIDTLVVTITPYSIVHLAPYLGGVYYATDTCTITPAYTYSSTWTCANVINNQVYINNFGAFGTSITVICIVDTTTQTLSFTTPVGLGSGSSMTACAGSYTHSGNSVQAVINYTWTDGTSTESCVSHYNK